MNNRQLAKSTDAHIIPHGMDEASMFNAIMDAKAALICDVSSSMGSNDSGEGGSEQRWSVMTRVVRNIVSEMEGKIAIIAFSDFPSLVTINMPQPNGSTNMAEALNFVAPLAATLEKIVLISDGEPTSDESQTLQAAMRLGKRIDTVYCGPRGGSGEKFLKKLAIQSGGTHCYLSLRDPLKLEAGLKTLLLPDGRKS